MKKIIKSKKVIKKFLKVLKCHKKLQSYKKVITKLKSNKNEFKYKNHSHLWAI